MQVIKLVKKVNDDESFNSYDFTVELDGGMLLSATVKETREKVKYIVWPHYRTYTNKDGKEVKLSNPHFSSMEAKNEFGNNILEAIKSFYVRNKSDVEDNKKVLPKWVNKQAGDNVRKVDFSQVEQPKKVEVKEEVKTEKKAIEGMEWLDEF